MRRRAGSLARALLRRARGDGASVARAPPRALAPASSPSRFLVPSSSSSRADRGASASASSFAPRLRGFAASARALLREHRDTRARVLSPEARLNQDIKACRAADDVLTLVARHGDRFNHVNVATAVNVLCKVTDARRDALNDDARYARLLSLVRARCREFRTREAASATHGLGILFAEKGAVVDADAADALVKVVLAHSASKRDMVPQAIANVLNAILKTDAFLRAVRRANANAVRPGGGGAWAKLARAAERVAPAFNAHDVSNVTHAYAGLRRVAPEALEAANATGLWRAVADATRRCRDWDAQSISLTTDAAKKVDGFARALDVGDANGDDDADDANDDDGWLALARGVARHAPRFHNQHAVLVLSALGWRPQFARAMSRVDGGWDAALAAVERNLDGIESGRVERPRDYVVGRKIKKRTHEVMKTLDAIARIQAQRRHERQRREEEEEEEVVGGVDDAAAIAADLPTRLVKLKDALEEALAKRGGVGGGGA